MQKMSELPPPPDPFRTLVRRTAAGEISPLVLREPHGAWGRLPDDALPVVVALLDAGGALSFEALLCDLENDRGPLPESLVARAKTVGDLLSALGRHRRTRDA